MTIATYNRKAIQAQGGTVYLVASPTTVVGVTTAAIVKELFALFYSDGDYRTTLTATAWTNINSTGFKSKISQKPIEVDPNNSAKFAIAYEDVGYEAEVEFHDVDVNHLKDVLSASAAQVLALTASVYQAARSTLLAGGQRSPTSYALLYRYPCAGYTGEYQHVLIPSCTLSMDGADREFTKSKASTLKVKIIAEGFPLLPDPTTGNPVVWLEDTVTAAKS